MIHVGDLTGKPPVPIIGIFSAAFAINSLAPVEARFCHPVYSLVYTYTPLAHGLLNDALRLINELSSLAATCSLQSVSKVQTLEAGCIFS